MARAESKQKPRTVRVTYRKMKFDFESNGFDSHWHGGSAFISHFWGALSTALPAGEKFFADSAKALRGRIDDPELAEDLAEFIRQEGHHGFQHRKFNRMLGDLGFDVARYETRYARVLNYAAEHFHPMQQLAVTVALEHFTATLAHEILSNKAIMEHADPGVSALWRWHAAEEIEHKSTCFDLYERLGGNRRARLVATHAAWLFILSITFRNTVDMMREEGRSMDFRDAVTAALYFLGPRGLLTKMLPGLISYYGPRFHPWQTDDAHRIADWEKDNARYLSGAAGRSSDASAPSFADYAA